MINALIIVFFSIFVSINASAFPLPKNEKAEFDIVRKNKIIGSHIIEFKKDENRGATFPQAFFLTEVNLK